MSVSDLFKQEHEKHRAAFMDHVRPEYQELAVRPKLIEWDEWQNMRMNSYEQRLLTPRLTDEALVCVTEYYITQSSRDLTEFELPKHYDDAVQRLLAPLLCERLKNRI